VKRENLLSKAPATLDPDGTPALKPQTGPIDYDKIEANRRSHTKMGYPEIMIRPMRQELIQLGVEELRNPEQVDAALQGTSGTVMVVVNSICGCAAGRARPGVALALQNEVRPDRVVTVFAGADIEATERARSYFVPYPPSSPSIALMKDGQLVFMLERRQIEGKEPPQIAAELKSAFERFCQSAVSAG
jgi:putative YphP/YqiW family bacilliredoxin